MKQESKSKSTKNERKIKESDNERRKASTKAGRLKIKYLGGALFKKMARGGANELRSNAELVNHLNVFPVPDGDTGDNMRMTIESGLDAIEGTRSDNLSFVIEELSHGMLLGARGNSGVILSQFFSGMAKGLENSRSADAKTMGSALEMAVDQAYSSVMTPMEGTILTVAREAVEYAVSRIKAQSTIKTLFADLVKEMRRSLDRTPELLDALREANVVDSGGAGLFYIMDGFNRVLNGEAVKKIEQERSENNLVKSSGNKFGPESSMRFGYCTELLIQLLSNKCDIKSFDPDRLRSYLATVGDSVVTCIDGSIVKVHVHTFTPELVLGKCREYGEFASVKIENMTLLHTEDGYIAENEKKFKEKIGNEKKKHGVVAVCNGAGVEGLFREFGADVVISCGQTKNPSTKDFLDAFSSINAEHIFVLPNNANILMTASQAAKMYSGASVFVVRSKSIGAGYAALSSVDLSNPVPQQVFNEMTTAISRIKVGYISPSVRDARINNIEIKEGDSIGIIEKEIVLSEPERTTALKGLVDRLVFDDRSMLTVFTGIDALAWELTDITEFIKQKYKTVEYYIIDGKQETYPYIFVAE